MEYQLIEPKFPHNNNISVVEQVFLNRGILPQNIEHYLNTTDDDILNPSQITNIKDGVKMLVSHIAKEDDILVIVDCDVDGYVSASFLLNYLNCQFPGYVQNHIYYQLHDGKQHGIEEKFIPFILKNGYKLVICPDSSSNDYSQHELLFKNNIDVLVIDHHEAEKVSEYACIINNQLCDYPTKSLSGVGMVYKFCCYIDMIMKTTYAENFVDLVALGLIGDMMDLRDFETRHLVVKGLQKICNPYFKEMVRVQNYSINKAGGINPFAISFYIAPQINATIRMGSMEQKNLLFESMLNYQAYEQIPSTKRGCKGQYETKVEQACRNCTNIKNKQTKARDSGLSKIEDIINKNNLLENKILAIKLDSKLQIDKNITGLIANQLMAKYQHPILLLNQVISPEGETTWQGSGRGYEVPELHDLREFLRESGYVFLAEGHANALGVGITDENFKSLVEYSNSILKDCDFTPRYKVDFIWEFLNFSANDIIEIAELNNIWGQGIEKPKIVLKNIQITSSNLILMSPDKSPTLKIQLSNGTSLIKFNSSKEEYEALLPSEFGSTIIDIVGTCNINEWNNKINAQIQIEDYEIVGKQNYYF